MKSVKGESATLTAEKIQSIKRATAIHRWLLCYLKTHWDDIWKVQAPDIKYVVAQYIGDNNKNCKPELSFFKSQERALESLAGNRFATLKYRFPDKMELML